MKSGWVDSEAQATVDRYAATGVAPDLALRIYTHAAARPRSARSCCTAAATPRSRPRMPDLLGDERRRAVRQGLRRRHGGRSSRPACRRCGSSALRKLRARDDAERRGHGARPAREPARSGGAQSVGRDAAARVPAAQVRRPHPRHRDAQPGRPAGRRSDLRRGLFDGRVGIVPYVMPGFALAKARRRRVRRRARASKA